MNKVEERAAPTVFVTRNAAINYLLINGMDKVLQFESARRMLTVQMLEASPEPDGGGTYLLVSHLDPSLKLRAHVIPEGDLLVVTRVVALDPNTAPLPASKTLPYTSSPAR